MASRTSRHEKKAESIRLYRLAAKHADADEENRHRKQESRRKVEKKISAGAQI
jgi:hypothetical protein